MTISALQYAAKAKNLFVLPDVYLRLREIIDDEQSTFQDIADILILDPILCSKLLKIANSALFNFSREIDTIDKALMMLGLNEINNLLIVYGATAACEEIDSKVIDLDRFWELSVDCALMCQFLAKKTGNKHSDGLFVTGLLHNIGELVVLSSAPNKVKYCQQYDKNDTPWERQLAVYNFTYQDCSAELLNLWQLPLNLLEPLIHQDFEYEQACKPDPLILYLAMRLALVNSHRGMYSIKMLIDPYVMLVLNLTYEDLAEAIEFCNAEALKIMASLKLKA